MRAIGITPVNGLETASLDGFDVCGVGLLEEVEVVGAVEAFDSGKFVAIELGDLVSVAVGCSRRLGDMVFPAVGGSTALGDMVCPGSAALGDLLPISVVGTIDKLGDLVFVVGKTDAGGSEGEGDGGAEVTTGEEVTGGNVSVMSIVEPSEGFKVGKLVAGESVGGYVIGDSVGDLVSRTGVGRMVSMAVTSAVGLKVGGTVSGTIGCGEGVGAWVGVMVGFSVTGFFEGLLVGLGVTGLCVRGR